MLKLTTLQHEPLTALPLLLSLRYRAFWRGNTGDYIIEEPVLLRRALLNAHRWCDDAQPRPIKLITPREP